METAMISDNRLRVLNSILLMVALLGLPMPTSADRMSDHRSQTAAAASPQQSATDEEGIVQQFRQFAIRGNVIDLATAVVIGGAFGKIVTSLVQDIIMPPLGALVGGVDFRHLYINLSGQSFASLEAAERAGAPLIRYGAFAQSVVDFSIIAFAVFAAIKAVDSLTREELLPPPKKTPDDIVLLREIRDSLKKQQPQASHGKTP
jgi:large conductance mechanosensitive channel